jgi:two-component system, cell cycle response regulator
VAFVSAELPRVLVVDDDADIVSMIGAALRRDYDVVTAPDGRAGTEVLAEGELAAVIADQMMPHMTGVELLDRCHALQPHAARILITASDRMTVAQDAINRAHVHRLLSKPLRLIELANTLGEAIREARLEAENARLATELAAKNAELARSNEQLEADVRNRTRELEIAVQKLQQLALRDGLTDLYNHRYLQEVLDAELSRARRHAHCVGLLFIDVDHFKAYNDANGHPAGDRLLRRLADVLLGGRESGLPTQARRSDIVARYGGEEFVMVLPETGLEGCLIKAERVRQTVEEYAFDKREAQPGGALTISIGCAVFPDHARDKRTLIDAADKQLYRAKHLGRNRVCAVGVD